MKQELVDLSIVIPVFNEQEILPRFCAVCDDVVKRLNISYEMIFVDDGSRDNTFQQLTTLQETYPQIKILRFSRNFGHQSAMTAGLENANGRACIIMDGDLQDPPDLIPEMLTQWKAGNDVVYAVRRKRAGETMLKKTTAKLFYRLLNYLSGINMPVDTGDFRLMDRKVVDILNNMPEKNRFLRGLVTWIGFQQTGIYFDRPMRTEGESKFPLWKMVKFALDGITSFSKMPLRLITFFGGFCLLGSCLVILWIFYVKFIGHTDVPGWTSLMGVILLLGSIQMLSLGIMGEYIARMFDETKQRPTYLVRDKRGF